MTSRDSPDVVLVLRPYVTAFLIALNLIGIALGLSIIFIPGFFPTNLTQLSWLKQVTGGVNILINVFSLVGVVGVSRIKIILTIEGIKTDGMQYLKFIGCSDFFVRWKDIRNVQVRKKGFYENVLIIQSHIASNPLPIMLSAFTNEDRAELYAQIKNRAKGANINIPVVEGHDGPTSAPIIISPQDQVTHTEALEQALEHLKGDLLTYSKSRILEGQVSSLLEIGKIYTRLGQLDEANSRFNAAIEIVNNIPSNSHARGSQDIQSSQVLIDRLEFECQVALITNQIRVGDVEVAKSKLEELLTRINVISFEDAEDSFAKTSHTLQRAVLKSLDGQVALLLREITESIQAFDESVRYYKVALGENEKLLLKNTKLKDVFLYLLKLLEVFFLKQFNLQERWAEQVRKLTEHRTLRKDVEALPYTLTNELGNLGSALALCITNSSPEDANHSIKKAIGTFEHMYSIAEEHGFWPAPEDLAAMALILAYDNQQEKSYEIIEQALARSKVLNDWVSTYRTHLYKGQLMEIYKETQKAAQSYDSAINAIERTRIKLVTDQSKLIFVTLEREEVYKRYIRLAVNSHNYQKGIELCEQCKSRSLLDHLGLHTPFPQNQNKNVESDYISSQWDKPNEYAGLQALVNSFDIEVAFVEFFSLYDEVVIFIMRQREEEPTVVRATISQEQLRYYVQKCYQREIVQWRGDIGQRWQELANPLLADVLQYLDGVELLYLIPHNWLHYLPLHALQVNGEYLIDRFPIVYAPSATVVDRVIRYHSRKKLTNDKYRALVLGYTKEEDEQEIFEGEAKIIAQYFGVDAHLGQNASRELIKENEVEYDVLHLSCHGKFDATTPLKSHLILADGLLTAHDIMTLKLNAKLVTLSACETALNELLPGDELVGLTRALLYAGVSSALITLWSVDAETTLELMQDFYNCSYNQHKEKLESKAVALQQAMLKARSKNVHPYYWAPFILVGNWQ